MLTSFHRIAPNGRIINHGSSIVLRQPSGAKITFWDSGQYSIDPCTFDALADIRDVSDFVKEIEQLRTIAFYVEKFRPYFEFCRPTRQPVRVKLNG